jgi:peptidoglycan hydrolase-like protein with peptidoglycan-binding domain
MQLRKANGLALTLLVLAAIGVSGSLAFGQEAAAPKTPAAKPGAKTHHSKSTKKTSRRVQGQKAPEPARISEIQAALGKDGSFAGQPNGKWDPATIDAMKKFQESHGLTPSGKLDAKTLQKLGLGSQTAGVAPPMPPVSSSSLLSNTPKPANHK